MNKLEQLQNERRELKKQTWYSGSAFSLSYDELETINKVHVKIEEIDKEISNLENIGRS